MTDSKGQVTETAAEVYERAFVPALFAPWAERLMELVVSPAPRAVLDIACGTGVLAREARRRFPDAEVSALDTNEGMLRVARGLEPRVHWMHGQAEHLPWEDGSFDVVASQFGLMFFDDRRLALSEMWRVLKPGGQLLVAVWDALESTPGYLAMARLLERLFGEEIARELHAPYVLGDVDLLEGLFREANVLALRVTKLAGHAQFPSIPHWVNTEIRGWTLAERLGEREFDQLLAAAQTELRELTDDAGRVKFRHDAIAVSAMR